MGDMNNKQTIRLQVDRYLSGKLTVSEADRLWADVLRHPELLDEIEAEAAARLLIHSSREGRPEPKRETVTGSGGTMQSGFRAPTLRWMTATIVGVLVVGFALWGRGDNHSVPDRIELTEMIAPDIYRDNSKGYDEEDVWINEGLALALRDMPKESIKTFRELLQRELTGTQEDAVRMNLAILYFNAGEYEKTQSELSRLLSQSREERPGRLTGKAWWMLGVSQVKLDNTDTAIQSFGKALQYDLIHEEQIRQWMNMLE